MNYATKSDLKNATGIDYSDFAKKVDLANLKSDINKSDICKLHPTPVDLSKLSNVVKNNDVAKKPCIEVAKVNAIQTNNKSN